MSFSTRDLVFIRQETNELYVEESKKMPYKNDFGPITLQNRLRIKGLNLSTYNSHLCVLEKLTSVTNNSLVRKDVINTCKQLKHSTKFISTFISTDHSFLSIKALIKYITNSGAVILFDDINYNQLLFRCLKLKISRMNNKYSNLLPNNQFLNLFGNALPMGTPPTSPAPPAPVSSAPPVFAPSPTPPPIHFKHTPLSKNELTNKEEIIMSKSTFNSPVTTRIVHTINDTDVNVMSKRELFNSILVLESSIRTLKEVKVKSIAIAKEIKQQKKVLKRVTKYLDAK